LEFEDLRFEIADFRLGIGRDAVVHGFSFNAQPKAPAAGIRAGAFGWAINELEK